MEQTLELKVPPPAVALLIGAAMWGAARLLPAVSLPDPVRLVIAGVFAVFGITVALLGVFAFRRAKTTLNPVTPEAASSVVTGGIFGYTRNPMYVGLTLELIGWAVWLSVPWVLLGPVGLMLFLTRFQIVPEERVMSLKFGRDYDQYRQRVRRWL
jgi:protein-S-isoprenylcysteine O-methyltransferase Ste14